MNTVIKTQLNERGILKITLNRPDKLNALNQEVLESLSSQFHEAEKNPQIKAVLLTGEGRAFCAGADIQRLGEVDAQSGYEFALFGQKVFRQLETLSKPSAAAINGVAFGGGCELAMAAHLRVASSAARLGQPEVKLGVIPGYGGTQRLARLVGKGRALELCLTGRFISAEEAYQWGLVNQLVDSPDPAALIECAEALLYQILEMAPLAVQSILSVINRGYDMTLDDALHLEALHFGLTCATKDKQEGVQAFLEKRPGRFRGE